MNVGATWCHADRERRFTIGVSTFVKTALNARSCRRGTVVAPLRALPAIGGTGRTGRFSWSTTERTMNHLRYPLLLILAASVFACGNRYRIEGANNQTLYTQTNLRAHGRSVSSLNPTRYETIIPACTVVRVGVISDRQVRFEANGQRYVYAVHRRSPDRVEQHVQRVFGTSCPNVQAMSSIDQQGIALGQVLAGMSKEGVRIAMGTPPRHRTPNLQNDVWTYWESNRRSYEVHFVGGAVVGAPLQGPNLAPSAEVEYVETGEPIEEPVYQPAPEAYQPAPEPAAQPAQYYTQTNLRFHRGQASSIGYTNQTLLPACTPVTVLSVNGRQAVLQTPTGGEITYVIHRGSSLSAEEHLDRILGPSCPSLTNADQGGVQVGEAQVGMTREGVIAALGFPPEHRTPALEANEWIYWSSRMRTFTVVFNGDVVVEVR